MLSETRIKSEGQAFLRSAPIRRDVERDPDATPQTTYQVSVNGEVIFDAAL